MQLGFYFDQTRCDGCGICATACRDCHDIQAETVHWMKIGALAQEHLSQASVVFMIRPCYHCARPGCMEFCPVGAIFKRDEDGIVFVDKDLCMACGDCSNACPYGSPQFEGDDNPEMQKCDFCLDRWEAGKQPVCVEACPARALDAGPITALKAKYGTAQEAVGFSYSSSVQPSIVCKSVG